MPKRAAQASANISLHESGFVLRRADQPADAGQRFAWQEITSMTVYKRDLFAYDLICLAIESNSTTIEIDEEYIGWDSFIKAAEDNLPGSVPVETWWPAVAHPAFATNQTTIYRREQPVA